MNPKHHKDNKGFSWSMRDGSLEYLSDDQINLFDIVFVIIFFGRINVL